MLDLYIIIMVDFRCSKVVGVRNKLLDIASISIYPVKFETTWYLLECIELCHNKQDIVIPEYLSL